MNIPFAGLDSSGTGDNAPASDFKLPVGTLVLGHDFFLGFQSLLLFWQ
jgi:hypothetical protein